MQIKQSWKTIYTEKMTIKKIMLSLRYPLCHCTDNVLYYYTSMINNVKY